jgi:hypothetical protein
MLTLRLPCLLLACAGLQAVAQSVTQTVPFSFSDSGALPLTIVTPGDFTGTLQPFNPALGTLESFQIDWSIDFSASGTVTGGTGGSFYSTGAGGAYYINGISYSGDGGGLGDGGPLGDPVSLFFNVSDSQLFQVADAGVSYNPSILTAVLGIGTFPLFWDTGFGIDGTDVSGVSGSAIGSVAITYNYVPEADTYAAAGLLVAAVGGVAWRRRSQV